MIAPGVIAQMPGILGRAEDRHFIDPAAESDEGEIAPLVLMIHRASHAQMSGALERIALSSA
jgi:hypothetical protein